MHIGLQLQRTPSLSEKKDDASISPLSSFEWQSLWGKIRRRGEEVKPFFFFFIAASSKAAVWTGKKEGETQRGGREGERGKKEGEGARDRGRTKPEVKVTENLIQYKLWTCWRHFSFNAQKKKSLQSYHAFIFQLFSPLNPPFSFSLSPSRRLWVRTTPSSIFTLRQWTAPWTPSPSGRSSSWTMWWRSWRASSTTPTRPSTSSPRTSSPRPASSSWPWGRALVVTLNAALYLFICWLHCFFSVFRQGRGFSKAMTAKEAQAFVGDASCHVNILQVNTLKSSWVRQKAPGVHNGFIMDLHCKDGADIDITYKNILYSSSDSACSNEMKCIMFEQKTSWETAVVCF